MDDLFQQFRLSVGADNLGLFDQLLTHLQHQREAYEDLRKEIEKSNGVNVTSVAEMNGMAAAMAATEKVIRGLAAATFEETQAAKQAADAERARLQVLRDMAAEQRAAASLARQKADALAAIAREEADAEEAGLRDSLRRLNSRTEEERRAAMVGEVLARQEIEARRTAAEEAVRVTQEAREKAGSVDESALQDALRRLEARTEEERRAAQVGEVLARREALAKRSVRDATIEVMESAKAGMADHLKQAETQRRVADAAREAAEAEAELKAAQDGLAQAAGRANVAQMTAKQRREELARATERSAEADREAAQAADVVVQARQILAQAEQKAATATQRYGAESREAAEAEANLASATEAFTQVVGKATAATNTAVAAKKGMLQAQRDVAAGVSGSSDKLQAWTRTVYFAAQGVEDLQFSWMAFANNLPLITQSAAQAMGASSAAAMGLASGIALVGTAITVALPHIQNYIDRHDDLKDGAAEFKETLKDTAYAIFIGGERMREAKDEAEKLSGRLEELKNKKVKVAVDYHELDLALKKERELNDARQARLDAETSTTESQRQSGRAVKLHLENVAGGEKAAFDKMQKSLGEELFRDSAGRRELDQKERDVLAQLADFEAANPGRTSRPLQDELRDIRARRQALHEKLTRVTASDMLGDLKARAEHSGDAQAREQLARRLRKIDFNASSRILRDSPEVMARNQGKTQEEIDEKALKDQINEENRARENAEREQAAEDERQADEVNQEAITSGKATTDALNKRRQKGGKEVGRRDREVSRLAALTERGLKFSPEDSRSLDSAIANRMQGGMEPGAVIDDLLPQVVQKAVEPNPNVPEDLRADVARKVLQGRVDRVGAIGGEDVLGRIGEQQERDAERARVQSRRDLRRPMNEFRQDLSDARFAGQMADHGRSMEFAGAAQQANPFLNDTAALGIGRRAATLEHTFGDTRRALMQAMMEFQRGQLGLEREFMGLRNDVHRLMSHTQNGSRVQSNLRVGMRRR